MDAATSFLLQSPPGEVNDCFNDIRVIISDDDAFEREIGPAFKQYNEEQLILVPTESEGQSVFVTRFSKIPAPEGGVERHWDPSTKQSYVVDHLKAVASDATPHPVDGKTEAKREAIHNILKGYVENHYANGVSGVWPLREGKYEEILPESPKVVEEIVDKEDKIAVDGYTKVEDEGGKINSEEADAPENKADDLMSEDVVQEEEDRTEEKAVEDEVDEQPIEESVVTSPSSLKSQVFGLQFVGNKYNISNYWTGRWRSTYVANYEDNTLTGEIIIHIHYYEQGNVQLSTTLKTSAELPHTPEGLVAKIKAIEVAAQNSLAESETRLSEETFKGLRRTLPKTKTKMDWTRVSAYKLGSELSGGKGDDA